MAAEMMPAVQHRRARTRHRAALRYVTIELTARALLNGTGAKEAQYMTLARWERDSAS